MWRWDQGHGSYFDFSILRAIAQGLCQLEGVRVRNAGDTLRAGLEKITGLPFPAGEQGHTLWRQYARVFTGALLATAPSDLLVVTDVCRWIATADDLTADEYLGHIVRHFRYPFATEVAYSSTAQRIYPFCILFKLLLARFEAGLPAQLNLDDVEKLIGGGFTGYEPVAAYLTLPITPFRLVGDARRQARELLRFISQFSFLSWNGTNSQLSLGSVNWPDDLKELTIPADYPVGATPEEEMLTAGRLTTAPTWRLNDLIPQTEPDQLFSEGRKVRVYHLRVERNAQLRRAFWQKHPTSQCDMCQMDVALRYPWATVPNLLELHHLLPLASAAAVSSGGTSLDDLVPVCPTCHRAVHRYYRDWLNANHRSDFQNRAEAHTIYEAAQNSLIL